MTPTFMGEPLDLPGQGVDLSDALAIQPGRVILFGVLHHPHQLAGVERALPICWLIEVAERAGSRNLEADAEPWQLAFDLGNVPPYALAEDGRPTSCPDCLEWLHA